MKASSNENKDSSGPFCDRHPNRSAVRQIVGVSLCSKCVDDYVSSRKKQFRKAIATRRQNAAARSQAGTVGDYGLWQHALWLELAKRQNSGVLQILQRSDVVAHVPELLGRIYQYCCPPIVLDNRIATFRAALLRAARTLLQDAASLRELRQFDGLLPLLSSYVLDQIALKANIASKAGEWIIPELRPVRNAARDRLEPERLEDEARDMTSFASALKFLNNSLLRQGDGLAAPILAYLDVYLKTLLAHKSPSTLLLKLVNAGLAASGSRVHIKPPVLQKRLRDYQKQHPITLQQLKLRARLMIEGPRVVGVQSFTTDSEHVRLPNGNYALLPRVTLLPPLPRRTDG